MRQTQFCDFVRKIRLEKEIPLRQFCKYAWIDPSAWSKIERGIVPAPQSLEMLNRIKIALDLDEEQFRSLKDLAAFSTIPSNLIEENILDKLPIFIQTVRGDKLTTDEQRMLIQKLTES